MAGLALGMAGCLLIFIWVQDELAYDRYHERHDRVYRVTRQYYNQDGTLTLDISTTAYPIAPLLKNDFPEIREAVRLLNAPEMLLSRGTHRFMEERLFLAEPEAFRVFTWPLTRGDTATALADPFSVVVTGPVARRYFGDEDPLGQNLTLHVEGHMVDLTVTGIMESVPRRSHIHPELIVSFKTWDALMDPGMNGWGNNRFLTYLLLEPEADAGRLAARLDDFRNRHFPEGQRLSTLQLQKLTDIHLLSHLDSEAEPNGDMNHVLIFSISALLLLGIACVNFINLATARAGTRAREVGVRKVVGANRAELIHQFFRESLLLAAVSLVLALALSWAALPWFNELTGKPFSVGVILDPAVMAAMAGMFLFVGLAAGVYPALVLSAFRPGVVLQGNFTRRGRALNLRSVMVVLQFAVSIGLIICMGVVGRQLDFVRTQSLGFDKDQHVVLPFDDQMADNIDSIKSRLRAHPGIVSATASKHMPFDRLRDSAGAFTMSGDSFELTPSVIKILRVDYDYIPTFGMKLAAGRNFSRDHGTDVGEAFILNESAVRTLGWGSAGEALGQPFGYGRLRGRVIGVVRDVHFESLHHRIPPLVLLLRNDQMVQMAVRLRPGDLPGTMAFLKDLWHDYRPQYPFSYQFLDDRFDQLYRAEDKLHDLFQVFAGLAVFVACLGLFGLAAFAAEQRTREIGIRKVLGATTGQILGLFSRELTRWVVAANLIAWPAAWFIMREWLESFPYRAELSPWLFVAAAGTALTLAVLTVAGQAWRSARHNPVDSLRNP
jgi:putative ABC transport system permease protein